MIKENCETNSLRKADVGMNYWVRRSGILFYFGLEKICSRFVRKMLDKLVLKQSSYVGKEAINTKSFSKR